MNNSQKFLKNAFRVHRVWYSYIAGYKKRIYNIYKVSKENLANKLDLVTKDEYVALKKLVEKQQEIKK